MNWTLQTMVVMLIGFGSTSTHSMEISDLAQVWARTAVERCLIPHLRGTRVLIDGAVEPRDGLWQGAGEQKFGWVTKGTNLQITYSIEPLDEVLWRDCRITYQAPDNETAFQHEKIFLGAFRAEIDKLSNVHSFFNSQCQSFTPLKSIDGAVHQVGLGQWGLSHYVSAARFENYISFSSSIGRELKYCSK